MMIYKAINVGEVIGGGYRSNMTKSYFFRWLTITHRIRFDAIRFRMFSGYIQNQVNQHPFTLELITLLEEWDKESIEGHGYALLMSTEWPPYHQKSYESVLDKIYRLNCVYNKKFPQGPEDGWIDHENYLARFNDLLRTKLSCKFIDGPEIVARKLSGLAEKHSLRSTYSSRNYDDGYYAYHFYVYFPIQFAFDETRTVEFNVAVEIQISTQLKEVMYEILHKFYADERSKHAKLDWKWDIESSKFKSGYIAHTLHLLEAMIVELRNKK